MSAGAAGFFLGIAPGIILAIRNGLKMQRCAQRASEAAKENGEYFEFGYSLSDRANYLIRPAHFIRETDGVGVRKGKQILLDERRPFLLRQVQSIIVAGVGALLVVLIALAV
jgi:hypothetical protein